MKIIFEEVQDFTFEERESDIKISLRNYRPRLSHNELFEIMIPDFPCALSKDHQVYCEVFSDDKRILLSKNCTILDGVYIVECERFERYEGEIIQRVWVVFGG